MSLGRSFADKVVYRPGPGQYAIVRKQKNVRSPSIGYAESAHLFVSELLGENRSQIRLGAFCIARKDKRRRYDVFLSTGFPIATGVIKGACRHLIKDRMDTGTRWGLEGAESILRLRSLRSRVTWRSIGNSTKHSLSIAIMSLALPSPRCLEWHSTLSRQSCTQFQLPQIG